MSPAPRVVPAPRYFGGILLAQSTSGAVTVSHVRYERGACRAHGHPHSFLAMVTSGGYGEHWGTGMLSLGATGVASHPAGITHADEILVSRTRILIVEAGRGLAQAFDDRDIGQRRGDPSAPCALGPTAAGRLATLLAWVRDRATLEPLVAESLAAEAFAEAHVAVGVVRGPVWVRRVTELLNEAVSRPLTLREVAQEVGVHPVYLSRAYRMATGTGLAETRRRARVRHAVAALAAGRPPAEVALDCGFADQSHLTRVVRRVSGLTPSRWRAVGRAD